MSDLAFCRCRDYFFSVVNSRITLTSSLLLVLAFIFVVGCSYRLGYEPRNLPGGYQQVAIPIFKNRTQETGIEAYFANSLTREFERSGAAQVVSEALAPVTLTGSIESVDFKWSSQVTSGNQEAAILPKNTVLSSTYRIVVHARIQLTRNSDRKILWESGFKDERTYSAPQVFSPGVNSVNPLYNHSARLQNIALIAEDMMVEAHDRITENF